MEIGMEERFELHKHLGYWLARLSNAMHEDFMSWLISYNITGPQWMVLNALYFKKGKCGSELSAYIGLDRAGITRITDQLVQKEMITRVENKNDRRFQVLELTPIGRKTIKSILMACKGKEERFTGGLTANEKEQFKQILMKMLQAGGIETPEIWIKF